MKLDEAISRGYKVRVDFKNTELNTGFFIVFDRFSELMRMINSITTDVEEYGYDGIEYHVVLYVKEEGLQCKGMVAEA